MTEAENTVLTENEAKKLLSSYGIRIPDSIVMTERFEEPPFEGPYAVKVSDPAILHKTDVGGVAIGISSSGELRKEFEAMKNRFPHSDVLVEKMIPNGVEIIAGIIRDPQFGLVLMAGLGGIYAELLKDRVFRLVPADRDTIMDMIMQTRISRFIDGFRGISISRDALAEMLLNLSKFALDHKDSLEGVDLNPVIARDSDIIIADAKVIFRKGIKVNREV